MRFEYEWQDQTGKCYRSYGNEMWEFDSQGLMARLHASINDAPITEGERLLFAAGRQTAPRGGVEGMDETHWPGASCASATPSYGWTPCAADAR